MDFAAARAKLVTQLRQEIRDKRVVEAIARVPRECFVPEEEQHLALELTSRQKVLEVGTGSGYEEGTDLDANK